jgi:hypothetical protein
VTFATSVSLSADGNGNGVLAIGTENLGNQAHSITEISGSELELTYSDATATSTFEGYGTSFSGTYTLTVSGPTGLCTVTRPQTLTLQGSGLTLVSSATSTSTSSTTSTTSTASSATTTSTSTVVGTSTSTTSTTSSSTSTGAGTGGSVTTSPPKLSYPCSTGVVSPCSVTSITLSGAPFSPVDGIVPQGTAEYKQLLALGYIPVSGECDEACVIEVQALLSSGQLKLGPRARAAAAQLDSLGQAQLKLQHGTASVRLKFTKAGKKLLGEVTAKNFEIEIKLWATTPAGKRLGKTKLVYLHVTHK